MFIVFSLRLLMIEKDIFTWMETDMVWFESYGKVSFALSFQSCSIADMVKAEKGLIGCLWLPCSFGTKVHGNWRCLRRRSGLCEHGQVEA